MSIDKHDVIKTYFRIYIYIYIYISGVDVIGLAMALQLCMQM